MRLLTFYIMRIKEELFQKLHIFQFYYNRYGLKNAGAAQLLKGKNYTILEMKELSAEELYLGPDYMKDCYTLLDCPLVQSPHYSFMEAIDKDFDLWSTDYIKRYMKGTLDWRRGKRKPHNIHHFKEEFDVVKSKILTDDYLPITVYMLNKRYYIFDGKHRAATCAYLGRSVKCAIVSNEIANIGVWHYMFSLIDKKNEYKLHTIFHNKYLNEVNFS